MKPLIEIYYRAFDRFGGAERVRIPYDGLCEWLQYKTELARELSQQLTIISVRRIDPKE